MIKRSLLIKKIDELELYSNKIFNIISEYQNLINENSKA